ncbi:hypothetical protein [Nannocystis pusilla]|uniref:hypothetical protein n=1 Tax=Nannocystis pusilla TaxID=889268 RepID=UPI003DA67909
MIRLRSTCSALLMTGLMAAGCVAEKNLDVAGASEGGSETDTTTSSAWPGTGGATLAAAGSGSTTTTGEPADPPTSGSMGGSETGETTSSTSTTTGDTSGTSGDDVPAPLSFVADIQPIFADYCTCHGDGEPEPDLGIGRAYDSIVGVPANDVKGMLLVAPGAYEDSYLWHKIAGSHSQVGGAGKRMPPNDELQPGDMAAIQQWIVEGAQP